MKKFIFYSVRFLRAILFFFIMQVGAAQPFEEIIAFGDSLTDVGNTAGLTKPGVSPMINGYYQKTHFSDHVLWVEIIAAYWKLPERTPGRGSGTTLSPQPTGNTWAWGGSEALSGSVQPPGVIEPIPNLLEEVNQYLTTHVPDEKTLYAIWSGACNLLVGGKFEADAAKEAVKAVGTAIRQLQRAGACNFLIFNLPNLRDIPIFQSGEETGRLVANMYSASYNEALQCTLNNLKKDPEFSAKIYFVNTSAAITRIVNAVKNEGVYTPNFFVPGPPVTIKNITDQGLHHFQTTGIPPTTYLFWDDVHPTAQGHQILAGLALNSITEEHRD